MMTALHSVPELIVQRDLLTLAVQLERAGLLVDVDGANERTFDHLAFDSRGVGPYTLFVAVRGGSVDGHQFIDKAVINGASAIVCEATPGGHVPPGVARIRVTNSRRALAVLAASFHGDAARRLTMVGVTGTNGKTTTAWLVTQALEAMGHPCGFIGTTGTGRPGHLTSSTHTTPDALALHGALAELVRTGCQGCAMEVSSHALDQERVFGIPFSVAVFTNLSHDHLDYHKNEENYLAAKRRLFDDLEPGSTAVVNADDPASAGILASCPGTPLLFGSDRPADIRYRVLHNSVSGLAMTIDGQTRDFRLSGRFNGANLAAAYGAVRALGYPGAETLDALAAARPAPGRFEILRGTSDRTALVDYAHTPDALRNVLESAREIVPSGGRLWCVFGCGGDRDTGKRPLMGAIAETLADRIVVTSDNPRTEDPEAILFDIRQGFARADAATWIVDRRTAIRTAIHEAASGDLVVVAGKGHENYQVVGIERRPFDDREEILNAFAAG